MSPRKVAAWLIIVLSLGSTMRAAGSLDQLTEAASTALMSVLAGPQTETGGTIFIRSDGSIDPPAAGITSADNVTYILTNSIYDGICVERDNVVVDGKGYTIQGTGNGTGINLTGSNNVTIRNVRITDFYSGIDLVDSSSNTLLSNNVTSNEFGISLRGSSSRNTLRNNDASDNRYNLGIFTGSSSGYAQDIDESNTVNGRPVYYWNNRSDTAVPLDAGYVVLVNCTRITVKNLNLSNNMQGIALAFTTDSTITESSLSNNFDGIRLDHSSNGNVISGNNITANTCYGIRLFYDPRMNETAERNVTDGEHSSLLDGPSCNNTICGNLMANNEDGIRLDYPSNNTVAANNVTGNRYGIGLYESSGSNTVVENSIIGNVYYGVWFYSSYGDWLYHNNFVGNAQSVYPSMDLNFWDNGYPSGGNYWSPRHGALKDIHSGLHQNETGSDGIGDTPYGLDKYPLMGMFSSYNATYYTPPLIPNACNVTIVSNSTVANFTAPTLTESPEAVSLQFSVVGAEGSTGFCRVSFPTALMNGTYHVSLNGTQVPFSLLPCSDANTSYLYFAYAHSTQDVTIVPEFPSVLLSSLFMMAALLGTAACRRRLESRRSLCSR